MKALLGACCAGSHLILPASKEINTYYIEKRDNQKLKTILVT